MKPRLLILKPFNAADLARFAERFDTLYAPDDESRRKAVDEQGDGIQAVLTIGTIGLTADEIARLPKLEFIAALGVGYEKIDVDAARARGIVVCNGAGANANCVADHAMALLLGQIRGVWQMDRACRAGIWRDDLPMRDEATGKRLGILGLGAIGEKLARRAAGFDMPIGYHNRSPKADSPHSYFPSLLELARWADCLVICVPGGGGTRHLVNAEILDALGPRGYLVNVARGSVVDTAALAAALREGRLAGAALDVYESEPQPPQELLDLDNVTLSPHLGGASPQALEATVQLFLENIRRHFAGAPVLTPV
jgi:lactate dehydrogenase-like 2-hydroxyacid dehydrogenase